MAQTEPIASLLKQCAQGNQKAQLLLYNQYSGAMYHTALGILRGQTEEAEEAMQEGFLKAFVKLDSYKGEVSFGAWLKKIVINEALQKLRKPISEEAWEQEKIEYALKNETACEPTEETTDRWQQIERAIARLHQRYRIVLQLFLLEGYDYEEISEILQLSAGNCRTLLHRAKEKLKIELKKLKE